MEDWKPLSIRPQLISIPIVVLILVLLSLVYYFKQKKLKANEAPHGYVLLVEIGVSYVRNLVCEILGPKMEKLTPIFLYLFAYIGVSNLIGIFGFENPTGSYTVTLSLALINWFGVWAVGFKYQKLSYLKNFLLKVKTKKGKEIPIFINPLEIMSNIAPLISMSFRLWGNITAGSIIVTLWFFFTNYVWMKVPYLGAINLLGGLTCAPIRFYFDVVSGLIQALVFTMLTMVYWTMAKGDDPAPNQIVKIAQNPIAKPAINNI